MSAAVAGLVAQTPRLNVPHHLLDTQLFPKLATLSNVLATNKQSILFQGYELGKVHRQKLALTNKANGARRMHILAPSSGYFNIKFKKTGKLMPGMSLIVIVEFVAHKYQHYEDFIKIHCEDRHNLVIPLHAYPVLDMASFPKQISLLNTPICKTVHRKIPLTSSLPVDFPFKLTYTGHPFIAVYPSSGFIPGEGTVELKVTFCPSEYVTASGQFELTIEQFDAPVYKCNITAMCQPGIERELILDESNSQVIPTLSTVRKAHRLVDPIQLDPSTLTPISKAKKIRTMSPKDRAATVVDGVRFPEDLNNPTAVAFVLNQTPGHLKARELKSGSAAATIAKQIGNERQLKAAVFESVVKQKALEERNNKLRWMRQLGADAISEEAAGRVLEERGRAREEYLITQAIFDNDEEFRRTETVCDPARVYRKANIHTDLIPSFDPYTSNEWGKRKLALTRFIRAVRRVIVVTRVTKRFSAIRYSASATKRVEVIEDVTALSTPKSPITPDYLPLYHHETYDSDMAAEVLGELTPPGIVLEVEDPAPLFALHVPKTSDLLGYFEHDLYSASLYEPPTPIPDRRVGAEDELINVEEQQSEVQVMESLQPPVEMFNSPDYPPLLIFNPVPNVHVRCPAASYLETSEEYYLDPLLRKPVPHRGPIQPLHRQEVIQGTQRWNKFPCQLMVSLVNTPTVGSVWAPRRDNLFPSDMAGTGPELLTGSILEEDEIPDDGDTGPLVYPVAESMGSEFELEFEEVEGEEGEEGLPTLYTSHGPNGPVDRVTRQTQLQEHLNKRQNNLGCSIHSRLSTLQDTILNEDLYLDKS